MDLQLGRTDAPDALADNSDTVPSLRTDLTQSPPENCVSSDLPAAAGLVGIPTLCPVCNSDCYPAGSFESKTVPPGKTLCARVEYAGELNLDGSLEGYLHSDAGDCLCGRTHGAVERTTDQKPNSLKLLVALIQKHCTLFHDQQNRAFASFTVNGHLETWPVGSPDFKDWAARRLYLDHGRFVGDLALKDALSFARGHARYEGQERPVHIRVAYHGDSIYYDLCDDDWQQVEISKTGWRVIPTSESPVRFRRFRNSRPQVMPVDSDTSEAIRLLRKYVHVAESDLPLVLAWLVTAFVPEIPHPILEMQGDMGSGKSKAQIFLARLIDPSVADALTLPSNVALLEQHFSQQHALVYDNVSRINDQVSDM